MSRFLTILILSIVNLCFSQQYEKREIRDILAYRRTVDSNAQKLDERIKEGSLVNKRGGWTAYIIRDSAFKNKPLRIRYSRTDHDEKETTRLSHNFYYKKGKLVFAEVISMNIRNEIESEPTISEFYLKKGRLLYSTMPTGEALKYLLKKEMAIRKICN